MYSTEFQDELGTSRSQERIEEALGNAESKRQLFNLPLCFIAVFLPRLGKCTKRAKQCHVIITQKDCSLKICWTKFEVGRK